jgi:hypothetical protein
MARTNGKWTRVYVDGYDMSGHARSVGTLGWEHDASPEAAYADAVKNVLQGQAMVTAGPINAMFDNTAATGFHTALNAQPTAPRVVTVAIGVNALPAAGNPVFCWKMEQAGYTGEQGSGFVVSNLALTPAAIGSGYFQPWGVLLHAKSDATAASGANTAIGIDDFGAATSEGGIFFYHLFSSDGTVTLTAEDAETNTNPSFSLITGATSGSITAAVTPKSGFVLLAEGADVRQFLRWQIAFGDATTCNFAAGLIRHYATT